MHLKDKNHLRNKRYLNGKWVGADESLSAIAVADAFKNSTEEFLEVKFLCMEVCNKS